MGGASGGLSTETYGQHDVICGYSTEANGTVLYRIAWRTPGKTVIATIFDTDPARAYQWFTSHDPI